jgi:hypothetical protein
MFDEFALFWEVMIPDFDGQTAFEYVEECSGSLAGFIGIAFGDELRNPAVR